MTSVVVSAVNNTVVVTENGSSTVVTVPQTSVVTATTAGPRAVWVCIRSHAEFVVVYMDNQPQFGLPPIGGAA